MNSRYRGKHYFPNLAPLAKALGHIEMTTPKVSGHKKGLDRPDEVIQEKVDKQAAKLARRAARYYKPE